MAVNLCRRNWWRMHGFWWWGNWQKFIQNISRKIRKKISFVRCSDKVDRLRDTNCHNVDRFWGLGIESDGGLLWSRHELSFSSKTNNFMSDSVRLVLRFGYVQSDVGQCRRDAERRDALYVPSSCACRLFRWYTVFLEQIFCHVACLRDVINAYRIFGRHFMRI